MMPRPWDDLHDVNAPPSAQCAGGRKLGPTRPVERYVPPPVPAAGSERNGETRRCEDAGGDVSTNNTRNTTSTATTTSSSITTSTTNNPITTIKNPTRAALPSCTIFDPWNTNSAGHQTAENRMSGSTDWRESRTRKLEEQYRAGITGGSKRIADTVGAGSADFGEDGRTKNGGWVKGAKGLRTGGQRSLSECWGVKKSGSREEEGKKVDLPEIQRVEDEKEDSPDTLMHEELAPHSTPQIFAHLTFYLNGSTAPLISDHKLKHVLVTHGGSYSLSLAKRRITHVILGAHAQGPGRCGGGLAASKVQKEISNMRGKGVKFVNAEWVLECVRRGKRVPEAGYSTGVSIAGAGQGSVYGMFRGGQATGA